MLIEERGLTVVKSCNDITSHSRMSSPTAKIENGEVWMMFSRPSTSSSVNGVERLEWSPAEMKMVGWVCLPTPFATSYLTYYSHLTQFYTD